MPFLNYGCYLYHTKSRHLEFLQLTDFEYWETNLIFWKPLHAILWNRSHFLILCSMKEKLCLF